MLSGCGRGSGDSEPRPVRVLEVAFVSPPMDWLRGVVRFQGEASVTAPFSGRLEELNAVVGRQVAAGAVLGRFDDYLARLEVRRCRDELERALSRNLSPEETAERRLALERAEERWEAGIVRAPRAGRIDAVLVERGAEVKVGDEICRMTSPDLAALEVLLPIGFSGELPPPEVSFPELPGETFAGSLPEPPIPTLAGHRLLRVFLSGPVDRLQPGMLGMARFPGVFFSSGVLVNDKAVLPGDSGEDGFVWLVRDGRAVRRPVRMGQLLSRGVEVIQGLEPGDLVIFAGREGLREGMPVKPVGEVLRLTGSAQTGSLSPPG